MANYVVQKLELELPLVSETGTHDENHTTPHENGTSSEAEESEEKIPPEQYIDILCNNKVC